jgi:hypothetical protein
VISAGNAQDRDADNRMRDHDRQIDDTLQEFLSGKITPGE